MMHHIVCDWASIGVFWRDLSAFYRAGCAASLELPALPIQHGDYAAWQRQLLTRGEFARRLGILGGKPAGRARAARSADGSAPSCVIPIGAQTTLPNPARLTLALRDCSREEGVSLFTVFAAAADTLLYRYSGQEDILLGIPLADRDRPELQSVVGFLLHTHVLRTRLSGDLTFRDCCFECKRACLIFMPIALRPLTKW